MKEENVEEESVDKIWLKVEGCWITELDKETIFTGNLLNDRHINFAQKLLRRQFPQVDGLFYTLLQCQKPKSKIKQGIQIIHDRGNHWVVASNFECSGSGVVQLYDSVYLSIDKKTEKVIKNLFECSSIVLIDTQKQWEEKIVECLQLLLLQLLCLILQKDTTILLVKQSYVLMCCHALNHYRCLCSHKLYSVIIVTFV